MLFLISLTLLQQAETKIRPSLPRMHLQNGYVRHGPTFSSRIATSPGVLADETARAILRESSCLPDSKNQIVLRIVRRFGS
jgi:hypothetical protein